ncbi:beta-galactosidase [Microbacterium invictum]|uniref:Beta-galactosidase n=1 Tax=Microbacterium invictum TaxID=515415 RepID=A0AA40SRA0_9MICO|nr:beta-galactosidase [Microbacterium invictum]MBB4140790.1 beta-galactosidase [Microbacterium invictum]
MHYGGDYNPEQWPEEVWPEDIRLMKEAGVTTVTLGVFAWSRIQPAEGEFDWGWLDRIIELLHAGGIQIDMATATASPPPWATSAYPEMLPRTAEGAILWPGSRQAYAPTSPDYRRLAEELVTELVKRYVDHPAIVMWHVNNELGCHLHADYSDHAQAAFRIWLHQRYRHIDALNEAWGTDFWSQRYTSFEQIVPPRSMPYSPNSAGVLDFKRFTSDALLDLYKAERDIIRAAGATQPITTNFMGAFPAADYWRWAPELDFISDDNYPDPNDPESFRRSAFTRDLMRSLKPGVPWILMEQASSAINWRPSNAPKAPGQLAALSAQAVARGADGVMFFQWRQSRRGSEKFLTGMLPHSGTDTRVWREVLDLGQTLGALPALAANTGRAPVAVVFDWENWWAISNRDHPVELDYLALVQRWYDALHRQHIPVDIVHPSHDLSDYSLVIAPHLYLLTDESARNVSDYVEQGGQILFAAFTDVVDETDGFRATGYLRSLGELLGITLEEFGALLPPAQQSSGTSAGDTAAVSRSSAGPGENAATVDSPAGQLRGEYLAEVIHAVDAVVLGTFVDGRNRGMPALTSRDVGAGRAYYLATIPDDEGMERLMGWLAAEARVVPLLAGLSEWVEVIARGQVLFAINHGTEHVTLTLRGRELRSGRDVDVVSLGQHDWVAVDSWSAPQQR